MKMCSSDQTSSFKLVVRGKVFGVEEVLYSNLLMSLPHIVTVTGSTLLSEICMNLKIILMICSENIFDSTYV